MTNYDYSKINNQTSDKFPYGTQSVTLIERREIKEIKSFPCFISASNKKFYKLELTTKFNKLEVCFDDKSQLLEALREVVSLDPAAALVVALAKCHENEFTRDYISTDSSLFEEAIACL